MTPQMCDIVASSIQELEVKLQFVLSQTFKTGEEITFKIVGDSAPRPAILYDLETGPIPQLPILLIGNDDINEIWPYRRPDEPQDLYFVDLAISEIISYLTSQQAILEARFYEKINGQISTVGYHLEICNHQPMVLAISLVHFYDYR